MTKTEVVAKAEKKLVGLHPTVAAAARRLVELSYDAGVSIVITQGLRTIEYQNELYAQGRTKPGPIVTKAKGGRSYHNYGLAIDFALLAPNGREISYDTLRDADKDRVKDWDEVVRIAKETLGFVWGGEFTTIVDKPHFEMTFGYSITELLAGKRPPKDAKQPGYHQIRIVVDGRPVKPGELRNGTTYVILRDLGEALGANIGWNDKIKKADINGVVVDGELIQGIMWVPLRKVLDQLGIEIDWDNETRTVSLNT